jgi:hypothetical protein
MQSLMQDYHSLQDITPDKKVDCDGPITLLAISESLFAITFVKILKLTLSMQTGRYC